MGSTTRLSLLLYSVNGTGSGRVENHTRGEVAAARENILCYDAALHQTLPNVDDKSLTTADNDDNTWFDWFSNLVNDSTLFSLNVLWSKQQEGIHERQQQQTFDVRQNGTYCGPLTRTDLILQRESVNLYELLFRRAGVLLPAFWNVTLIDYGSTDVSNDPSLIVPGSVTLYKPVESCSFLLTKERCDRWHERNNDTSLSSNGDDDDLVDFCSTMFLNNIARVHSFFNVNDTRIVFNRTMNRDVTDCLYSSLSSYLNKRRQDSKQQQQQQQQPQPPQGSNVYGRVVKCSPTSVQKTVQRRRHCLREHLTLFRIVMKEPPLETSVESTAALKREGISFVNGCDGLPRAPTFRDHLISLLFLIALDAFVCVRVF